jgi:hypothetical protein
VDELGVGSKAKLSDFSWKALIQEDEYRVDVSARYNMQEVNNLEAMGYENIDQRFNSPEQNRDLAHEGFFDKLLAEYFL